jgi:hypothetical protein
MAKRALVVSMNMNHFHFLVRKKDTVAWALDETCIVLTIADPGSYACVI